MGTLAGRRIVLGVTGGIAAYKAVEIASRLKKSGAEVHVVMTRAAASFVAPLTFREITGRAVATSMWAEVPAHHVEHIALAEMADLVLVAPATANFIAKAAAGIADDLLTTTVLATRAPLYIAPAMNTGMWENPATRENVARLRDRGARIIPPAEGPLACGTTGAGRLPEPEEIAAVIERHFASAERLVGRRIIVTAGGTEEALDPVRYLGNRSTGRMGYAVAAEAARRGAEVILISAPTHFDTPAGVRRVNVRSAREMYAAVMAEYENADAVVKAAAVADYRPAEVAPQKIKKSDGELTITLTRNPDILFELGRKKTRQVLVGFAAETENVETYAQGKLTKKNLDFIVANNVAEKDAGFSVGTNRVKIFFKGGRVEEHPLMAKSELAGIILDRLAEAFKQKT
ncbi:bifunctional phosphopantothenoylcysteine decarboxylase/phosphopantothenate--cysteine ligase CoaBC [Selenomonas sp. F0473]|uniref:bifunctional phosphopantothenoylcysteine decarboxylase/phosphopantothenate--cysteine ligase CoaBC n=1 Tax=Selenomonas sp. F0473 TaxID=999423 RepID=UPI00029E6C9A|nr:bifunctional phosphopantothenoylcysteine decarboxylase/phosphopantothenate--cysteine ligase CoaBC [Selenomonas sp. F0473]EKU70553.1 phosphopantothenoylcysteine decarboxylase/phosphopantothenate-cysteine ligase [Selenomonas sp. F0473]